MDFDWQKYLLLARHIQTQTEGEEKNGLTEAMQRTAVSRAYYAMFHFAEDFATLQLSYQHAPTKTHDALKAHFSRLGRRDIADVLGRMNKARAECDYDRKLSCDVGAKLKGTLGDATYLKDLLKK